MTECDLVQLHGWIDGAW